MMIRVITKWFSRVQSVARLSWFVGHPCVITISFARVCVNVMKKHHGETQGLPTVKRVLASLNRFFTRWNYWLFRYVIKRFWINIGNAAIKYRCVLIIIARSCFCEYSSATRRHQKGKGGLGDIRQRWSSYR